ncbi:MAG: SRPBCC family protein [Euryarchaeota archaeon]|nr:SRPBCC family protein [Euryarchaeota archaeon]
MNIFKPLVLKDSVEIKTTPEKIWAFFYNLEENYKAWHPEEHVLFKWTKGKPMETGSGYYAEEYIHGKLRKFYGTIGEVVPYRKIVFNHGFPISLASAGFELHIEPKDSNSVFTSVSYIRAEKLMRVLVKFSEYKEMENLIKIGQKHTREEGENLKKILEGKND